MWGKRGGRWHSVNRGSRKPSWRFVISLTEGASSGSWERCPRSREQHVRWECARHVLGRTRRWGTGTQWAGWRESEAGAVGPGIQSLGGQVRGLDFILSRMEPLGDCGQRYNRDLWLFVSCFRYMPTFKIMPAHGRYLVNIYWMNEWSLGLL